MNASTSDTTFTGDGVDSAGVRNRHASTSKTVTFGEATQPPAVRPESIISATNSSIRSSKSYIRPYFRTRRVAKSEIEKPWLDEPRSKWPFIIPVTGIVCGLALIGVQIYLGWASIPRHKYCLVMEDQFEGSTLNASNWNQEVELGGFG